MDLQLPVYWSMNFKREYLASRAHRRCSRPPGLVDYRRYGPAKHPERACIDAGLLQMKIVAFHVVRQGRCTHSLILPLSRRAGIRHWRRASCVNRNTSGPESTRPELIVPSILLLRFAGGVYLGRARRWHHGPSRGLQSGCLLPCRW